MKFLLLAAAATAAAADSPDKPAWAVPTFESLGLYYNRPAAQSCKVQYRAIR
jgi:hypothetical protein